MRQPRKFSKGTGIVEIPQHRRNTVQTQGSADFRPSAQAQQPVMRLQEGRGAQGHVAATGNQECLFNEIAPFTAALFTSDYP